MPEPSPGSLGTLTLQPATGTDATAPVAVTSAGCSVESDAYLAKVYGPGGFEPGLLATFGLQTVNFSTTTGFPVQFTKSMADIALDNQTTVVAGTYTVEAVCMDSFSQQPKGTFTTKMYFTTPKAYQSTPPGGGTPTTTPTSSSEPPPTTSTEVTTTQPPQQTVAVTVGQTRLADTGGPVGMLLLLGIVLIMVGAYTLYTTRRRRVHTPWPED